jgi:hypothetical protein
MFVSANGFERARPMDDSATCTWIRSTEEFRIIEILLPNAQNVML